VSLRHLPPSYRKGIVDQHCDSTNTARHFYRRYNTMGVEGRQHLGRSRIILAKMMHKWPNERFPRYEHPQSFRIVSELSSGYLGLFERLDPLHYTYLPTRWHATSSSLGHKKRIKIYISCCIRGIQLYSMSAVCNVKPTQMMPVL
jgi:hypothetical protein